MNHFRHRLGDKGIQLTMHKAVKTCFLGCREYPIAFHEPIANFLMLES